MILGHGSIGQFAVAEALAGTVVNAGTHDVTLGQGVSWSIGTETVTGTAEFSVTTAGAGTFSLGTEVATGGANVSPTTDQFGSPKLNKILPTSCINPVICKFVLSGYFCQILSAV